MSLRDSSPVFRQFDGSVDLPPGKIATIATYFELRRTDARSALADLPVPVDARFERLDAEIARYRALYRAVGERWLWFSRARLSNAAVGAILRDPDVEALAFRRDARDIGLVELDFRKAPHCELSFLGLLPEEIGRGSGKVMIAEAIRRAFARPIERLWLHTCTLDHPVAVPFYAAAGLRPFKRAVEIADDPRLTGDLPRNAAPSLPIV